MGNLPAKSRDQSNTTEVIDEAGAAERFQRALRKALNTRPKRRSAPTPKATERPASKGRVHKEKMRN
jgi:hypothetical protein